MRNLIRLAGSLVVIVGATVIGASSGQAQTGAAAAGGFVAGAAVGAAAANGAYYYGGPAYYTPGYTYDPGYVYQPEPQVYVGGAGYAPPATYVGPRYATNCWKSTDDSRGYGYYGSCATPPRRVGSRHLNR